MPRLWTSALSAVALSAVGLAQYSIDPDSVDKSLRNAWCQSELGTCPIICKQVSKGEAEVNTCDPDELSFDCVCSNGLQPNVSEYTLTLPYFICTEWGNQCVKKCGSDNKCSNSCRVDNQCGARAPKRTKASKKDEDDDDDEDDKDDEEEDDKDDGDEKVLGSDENHAAARAAWSTAAFWATLAAVALVSTGT